MGRLTMCMLSVALSVSLVGEVSASGRYAGGRKPPAGVDSTKYDLGKALFKGKQAPGPGAAGPAAELSTLQDKLPVRYRRKADLPGMAGKMSDQQYDALKYFLKVRYKVEM